VPLKKTRIEAILNAVRIVLFALTLLAFVTRIAAVWIEANVPIGQFPTWFTPLMLIDVAAASLWLFWKCVLLWPLVLIVSLGAIGQRYAAAARGD
jgi:hypothetical protein